MTDTKHTPGPWSLKDSYIGYDLIAGNGGWLFELSDNRHVGSQLEDFLQEQEANARLIAAAPELLEALKETLKEALGWLDDARGSDGEDYDWVIKARTAIDKAEGKS